MLLLKYLLLASGTGLLAGAAGILFFDAYRAYARGALAIGAVRWRAAGKIALLAWLPLLAGSSITVVPDGMAGVRVSQVSGVLPGTLYPGVHLAVPFVQSVALYDIRERIFTTSAGDDPKAKAEALRREAASDHAIRRATSPRHTAPIRGRSPPAWHRQRTPLPWQTSNRNTGRQPRRLSR